MLRSIHENFSVVLDLAEKTKDLELKSKLIDLKQQVSDLREKNVSLLEENRSLKDKLTFKEELTFEKNAYWNIIEEEGPFCSNCYDSNDKLVRLHISNNSRGHLYSCPCCHSTPINNMKPPNRNIEVRGL